MTYETYSKLSQRLSALLLIKHKKGLTKSQQEELDNIADKIYPYAF